MDSMSNRLRCLRIESDLSQRQLAAELGVSNATISRIEKGRQPSTKILIAYAEYFGVSMNWIIDGKEFGEYD